MSQRPMPVVDSVSRPFWDGCNAGRFILQRCDNHACRRYVYYPRVCCPYCHTGSLTWVPVSGNGRIESYTSVHRHRYEGFMAEAPISFIAVRLDEGPLIYSRLTGGSAAGTSCLNRMVHVVFSDDISGQRLPYFTLVEDNGTD